MRIEVVVLEINERAVRCYERCAFRVVGRVGGAVAVDGEHYDDLFMEVRRDDGP